MSGEGLLSAAYGGLRSPLEERADFLAYLEQRIANCATMARHSAEHADMARDRQRQLEVMRDEVSAGVHLGAADVRAVLAGSGV